ncbi:MAG: hypothetical protein RLZZ290_1336, partial [Pseudomonadota bacterium]
SRCVFGPIVSDHGAQLERDRAHREKTAESMNRVDVPVTNPLSGGAQPGRCVEPITLPLFISSDQPHWPLPALARPLSLSSLPFRH